MIPYENQMLKDAYQRGYAIPAFNFSDIWELLAITQAAKEERAKVYVATNMKIVKTLGFDYCSALGTQAYISSNKAAMLHLDHATDTNVCLKAVDYGYKSVMVDASACELDENIAKTKKVVEYANAKGTLVEAELGRIMGNNAEGNFTGGDFLAEVDECVKLIEATGVNSIAVGIGNAHGFYAKEPKLNIKRLKEIHVATNIPLVLHGGTGIPEDQVKECIANGIAKINVGTLLHCTYIEQLIKELNKERQGYNINELFGPVMEAVKEKVKYWIELCGAANRI